QVKGHPVAHDLNEKIDGREMEQARVAEDGPECDCAARLFGGFFRGHGLTQGLAFLGTEPMGVGGPVGEIEVGPDSNHGCEQPLYQEHKLPALQAESSI